MSIISIERAYLKKDIHQVPFNFLRVLASTGRNMVLLWPNTFKCFMNFTECYQLEGFNVEHSLEGHKWNEPLTSKSVCLITWWEPYILQAGLAPLVLGVYRFR